MSAYLTRLEIDNVENVEEEIQTQYLKRVSIVEVVDQDGRPWEPVPGPDPWDDLVVANGCQWYEDNVYEIGETIGGVSATYVGGSEQVTYRTRVQYRPSPSDPWENSAWTTHLNVPSPANYTITRAGQARFQTQARDEADDPVTLVNSFASIKDIPHKEFGDISVTVNDIDYNINTAPPLTILMNDPLPVVVSITGNATPTYVWAARNDYPLMIGSQTASTVLTFPSEGVATVTCTLTDSNTEEINTSIAINFYVVDAFD